MFQDFKVAYLRENVKVKEAKRFSLLRQGVAYMLSISARDIPHAAMTTELDLTPLVEYCRKREKELAATPGKSSEEVLFKRAICKIYSAFFLKVFAHSLHHVPCMNSFLDYSPLRNGGTLYHAEDVNIGFTVHTKYGVVRPVMRNAHLKTIETVAAEMRDLTRRSRRTDPEELYRNAAKIYLWPSVKELDLRALYPGFLLLRDMIFPAKKKDDEYAKIPEDQKLDVREILGATCSIANIGMMVPGHQTVTVLAPPEVMMFGLGHLHEAPRVVDGEIVARTIATLCATMDHRAFDAGEAFPFGDHLFRYLEHPDLIYEWKEGDAI